MSHNRVLALGLLGLGLTASPQFSSSADAAVVLVTYTGKVESVNAGNTLFGGVTVGETFNVVQKFDTSLGVPNNFADASKTIQEIDGGSAEGTSSPSLGSVIMIGGNTYSFGGGYFGELSDTHNNSGGNDYITQSVQLIGSLQTSVFFEIQGNGGFPSPASLTTSFSFAPQNGTGSAEVSDINQGPISRDNFTVDSVTVALAAVPEPATWTLFILGFGGIGAAMRGQRAREGAPPI